MRAMLAEKKVDMIPAVLPFSLDPELRKIARPLFNQRDAIGVTQMIVWTARKSFIDKNRAALVDFMEDSLRIVRWYLDRGNHKEVMEIAGASPSSRPSASTGCSPSGTPTAIPTCCPISTRCRRTST
jgi:NitT/TauT family transport system substrate-binding protein